MAVSLLRTTHRKVLGAIVCDGYAMLAVAAWIAGSGSEGWLPISDELQFLWSRTNATLPRIHVSHTDHLHRILTFPCPPIANSSDYFNPSSAIELCYSYEAPYAIHPKIGSL
ncbi:uncharacterized protein STEHIDRAFT_121352 [Stereum hirsutum FP-91666 SS1]|uniref:uncharacterized protein n=1 Tax=Stereum hirsutum (strain FP-91666) TaxID=721885 RepID=UPI000440EC56|nr:uncharacterized protein STEHIDRAFT_121352 [Stereum hirsutum FP-91666 SS1]EIM86365.1 hypothetical protein STEHIDRAFT_121352 [Stereum hirsutum FP-91666 SS1]